MNSSRFPPKNDAGGALPPTDRTAWLKGGKRTCLTPPRKSAAKPWRIILLGVPGIGKSTQAKLLCERLGTCHLSIRDIFHAATSYPKEGLTPAIQNALDYLKRGEVVPDETVLNLVGERLRCLNCSGGFLLDGFPPDGRPSQGAGTMAGKSGHQTLRCISLCVAGSSEDSANRQSPHLFPLQHRLSSGYAAAKSCRHL